jgi:membrane-associated phospholipid phosphatase
VLGYELPDMQARFGSACAEHRLLPSDDQSPPSGIERLRCYLTVLLPWFLIYEAFVVLGVPPDAKIAYLPFESRLPVLPWTDILYGSVYVMVLLAPLIVRTRHDLRLFSSRALLSMLIIFPLYLAVPLMAPPRSFTAIGRLGEWLNLDRAHDSPAAAFPSFHVVWAFIAAEALARGPWQKRLWRAWAVLVSASCVTTGMHALVDVVAGLLVTLAVIRMDRVWSFLRRSAENIANSWKEWRIGSGRVINHGAYAGAGVFIGIWIIDTLLGPGKSAIPIAIFLGGCVGGRVMGADHRRLSGFAAAVGILRRDDRDLDLRRDRRLVDADRHLAGAGGPGGGRTLDPGHRPVALPGAGLLSWAPRR